VGDTGDRCDRLTAACYSCQRVAGETERGPFIHMLRPDLLVEVDRQLVPVQHRPIQSPAIAINGNARELTQQGETHSVLSKRGSDEEVLEIDPALAEPG